MAVAPATSTPLGALAPPSNTSSSSPTGISVSAGNLTVPAGTWLCKAVVVAVSTSAVANWVKLTAVVNAVPKSSGRAILGAGSSSSASTTGRHVFTVAAGDTALVGFDVQSLSSIDVYSYTISVVKV